MKQFAFFCATLGFVLLEVACQPEPRQPCTEDGECVRGAYCSDQGYCELGDSGRQTSPLDASASDDAGHVANDAGLADSALQGSDADFADTAQPDSGQSSSDAATGTDSAAVNDAALVDAVSSNPDSAGPDSSVHSADAALGQSDAGSAASDASSGVDSRGPEVCDGIDNDGVGGVDDGLTPPEICVQVGVCAGTVASCAGQAGWVCHYANQPNYQVSEQSCDGLDNDCDGSTDVDLSPPDICPQEGACAGLVATCTGTGGWVCDFNSVQNYQADEDACDYWDNDCDGQIDECPENLQCHSSVAVCTDPLDIDFDNDGLTERAGDCGPNDAAIKPGLVDVVDNKDNNCDGFVDEFDDQEGEILDPDRQYHAATVNPAREYDYWPMQLAAGAYHLRVVAWPSNSVDLRCALFAQSGQMLGESIDSSGPGEYEILNLTIQDSSQTYFLGVTSNGSSVGAYQVGLFPGYYDTGAIAGGDAPSQYTSIPNALVVIGAQWNGPDAFGNVVDGDELVTLSTDGSTSFGQISNFRIPGMLIRDIDLSPARSRIAFASNWNGGRYDVYVHDLTTERVRRFSPDQITCPSGMATSGFNHPSFVDENKLAFIGECLCMDSNQCTWGSELDLLFTADLSSDAAATWLGINPNGCYQPVLIPRAKPGGVEVDVSSNGCAINIAGETTTGGKITRYALSNGETLGSLPALIAGQTADTQHKLAGWDISPDGLYYAVVTDEGIYEFSSSTGAIVHGPISQGPRPNSGVYWNLETIHYAPGGDALVYTYWVTENRVDVKKLNLLTGTWTSLAKDLMLRRGPAW